MADSERLPKCDPCTDRSTLGRWLAVNILPDERADCPGPDWVDRFTVEVNNHLTPGTTRRTNTVMPVTERTMICHQRVPELTETETLYEIQTDREGRRWYRIDHGDQAQIDLFRAVSSMDEPEDPMTTGMYSPHLWQPE